MMMSSCVEQLLALNRLKTELLNLRLKYNKNSAKILLKI